MIKHFTSKGSRTQRPSPDLLDHEPPRDHEAEAALLASILLTPALMGDAASTVHESDFDHEQYRAIFQAMLRLHRCHKPIDITLLVGDLKDHGQFGYDIDQVCAHTLIELYRLVPNAANWQFYAARVLETSRRRRAIHRGCDLLRAAYNIDTPAPPAIRRAFDRAIAHHIKQKRKRV